MRQRLPSASHTGVYVGEQRQWERSGSIASCTVSGPVEHPQRSGLNAAIDTLLPSNYNFEIHKTIHHARHYGSTCVALQMPEGLTLWATAISDIVERFTDATTVIMGDVTYGACCVDDYTAKALGCDFLVHYGHSAWCLLIRRRFARCTSLVEIAIDPLHLVSTIRSNFSHRSDEFQKSVIESTERATASAKVDVGIEGDAEKRRGPTHLVLVGTVQFINALHGLRDNLDRASPGTVHRCRRSVRGGTSEDNVVIGRRVVVSSNPPRWHEGPYRITIPQVKPLSPGEILGCTSPKLPQAAADEVDAIVYVGVGRFHLESIMISNPRTPAFRYDPYEKRFVREWYDHGRMRSGRGKAVDTARDTLQLVSAPKEEKKEERGWGLVLGTLGRQGSTKVLSHLQSMLEPTGMPHIPILSELSPQKLSLFGPSLVAFVQTSCPAPVDRLGRRIQSSAALSV
ncbi:hypothetical protein L7F22_033947 [Adiantum nelumboides]|nr:hypothetical protein [Adiantum nelumboides]